MDEKTLKRFMKFVKYEKDCWIWTGGKDKGYGQFSFQKKVWRASRLIYTHCFGDIEEGLVICHAPLICHNRACVNPEHLSAETEKTNYSHRIIDGTDAHGEKNGNSKLTAEQVLEIRASDKTQKELAIEFNVSQPVINYIIARKNWKHI